MPRGFMNDVQGALLPLSASAREKRFNDAAKAAGYGVDRSMEGGPMITKKADVPTPIDYNRPKRARIVGPQRAQIASVRG